MVLNIEKYAQGNAFYVASARQRKPVEPQAPLASGVPEETKSGKKDDELKLLDLNVLNEVIKNGLPNEVSLFIDQLKQYEYNVSHGLVSNPRTGMYTLLNMANNIINNKKLYDNVIKNASEKLDCMSDYAVDQTGLLYVKDQSGEVKTVSLKDYNKNRKNYHALTYGDISNLRMYSSDQSFDRKILQTVNDATGLNKVQKHIWDIVKALGSNTTQQSDYESIMMVAGTDIKNPTKVQREGFLQLLEAYDNMDPNSMFKVLRESKSPNVLAALNYIWNALPNNYKMCLSAKSVIDSHNFPSPGEMISQALAAGINTESKYNVNFEESINKNAGGSGRNQVSLNPVEEFFTGDLNKGKFEFTDNRDKNQHSITLMGNSMATITKDNGTTFQDGPLYNILKQPNSMSKYLDMSQVYVGNKKVSQYYLQNVVYDGSQVACAWVPVDNNHNIDFTKFAKFQKAQEEIENRLSELGGNVDADTITRIKNQIYKDNDLDLRENADGSFVDGSVKMEKYFVVYANVNDDEAAKDNWMSYKFTGDEEDLTMKQIKSAFSNNDISNPYGAFHRMFNGVYRTPVFIKVSNTAQYDASSYAGHGSVVSKNSLERNMVLQESERRSELPINASSSLIANN